MTNPSLKKNQLTNTLRDRLGRRVVPVTGGHVAGRVARVGLSGVKAHGAFLATRRPDQRLLSGKVASRAWRASNRLGLGCLPALVRHTRADGVGGAVSAIARQTIALAVEARLGAFLAGQAVDALLASRLARQASRVILGADGLFVGVRRGSGSRRARLLPLGIRASDGEQGEQPDRYPGTGCGRAHDAGSIFLFNQKGGLCWTKSKSG